jgi:hypothetical protein
MPPLEFAGYRYIVIRGEDMVETATQEPTYIVHHCNPEKVASWEEYKKKLAAARGGGNPYVSDYAAAKVRDRMAVWDYALKFKCPVVKCSAAAGKKCINISEANRGRTVFTKHPHSERCNPDFTRFEESAFDKTSKEEE